MASHEAGSNSKLHFVLVHGSGHGAWCWFKIRTLMETSGYKVTALDLKGAGMDLTDPNAVYTFEEHNQPLIHLLSNLTNNQKVILVGHSAGGLSLTYAIHHFGDKIQMAIYVAANMLKYGFTTDEDTKDGLPDLSRFGDISELEYALGRDNPPTSSKIKTKFQREILYHLSPIEDSTLASMLIRPSPSRAFSSVKFIPGPISDEVHRVFIKTKHDRVISREQQDAMIYRWPPALTFDIESEHSPFFSAPFVLFGLIVKAVETNVDMVMLQR
ncbi:hypothetical protein ACFE04_020294 [Oxalis oulophora]